MDQATAPIKTLYKKMFVAQNVCWILTFELTCLEHKHTQGEEQSNLQEHGGLIGEVFQVLSCHL